MYYNRKLSRLFLDQNPSRRSRVDFQHSPPIFLRRRRVDSLGQMFGNRSPSGLTIGRGGGGGGREEFPVALKGVKRKSAGESGTTEILTGGSRKMVAFQWRGRPLKNLCPEKNTSRVLSRTLQYRRKNRRDDDDGRRRGFTARRGLLRQFSTGGPVPRPAHKAAGLHKNPSPRSIAVEKRRKDVAGVINLSPGVLRSPSVISRCRLDCLHETHRRENAPLSFFLFLFLFLSLPSAVFFLRPPFCFFRSLFSVEAVEGGWERGEDEKGTIFMRGQTPSTSHVAWQTRQRLESIATDQRR